MGQLRIAMIGCGANANDHARSLREAGFEIAAVCGTRNSPRVGDYAKRHEIGRVFNGSDELLDAPQEWDALAIVVSPEATLDILERALTLDIPIFVEKPIAFQSERIKPLVGRDLPVIVGYNRRYYKPAIEARQEVLRSPPVITRIEFPVDHRWLGEQSIEEVYQDPRYLMRYFSSVAILGFDLARFVLGDLAVQHTQHLTDADDRLLGIAATLTTESGGLVQFLGNFHAVANFSITLDWPNHRFELKPFEFGTVYNSLEMVGPTPERPMRMFTPKVSKTIPMDDIDYQFKPGYVAEGHAIKALIRGEDTGVAARIEDAYATTKLAEDLAGRVFPEASE